MLHGNKNVMPLMPHSAAKVFTKNDHALLKQLIQNSTFSLAWKGTRSPDISAGEANIHASALKGAKTFDETEKRRQTMLKNQI